MNINQMLDEAYTQGFTDAKSDSFYRKLLTTVSNTIDPVHSYPNTPMMYFFDVNNYEEPLVAMNAIIKFIDKNGNSFIHHDNLSIIVVNYDINDEDVHEAVMNYVKLNNHLDIEYWKKDFSYQYIPDVIFMSSLNQMNSLIENLTVKYVNVLGFNLNSRLNKVNFNQIANVAVNSLNSENSDVDPVTVKDVFMYVTLK